MRKVKKIVTIFAIILLIISIIGFAKLTLFSRSGLGGLEDVGWLVVYGVMFLSAVTILILKLFVIIVISYTNKSMKCLKKIAKIDVAILIAFELGTAIISYLLSITDLTSNRLSSILSDISFWGGVVSLCVLIYIMLVCISVLVIRKIKRIKVV